MWDPYAEFQSVTLPNGLTVYAAHWPNRPSEAIGFLIHSGARHDPVGFEGLAHFVEHLVSENASIPEAEIHKFFERHGGNCDLGETSCVDTQYKFLVPNEMTVLAEAFSLFGNMLLHARLEKHIEKERKLVIGEFYSDFPTRSDFLLAEREHRALFPGLWAERMVDPGGSLRTIRQISKSDLQKFYDKHYAPTNISVVGVGGVPLQELVTLLLESPFAADKSGKRKRLQRQAKSFANPHIFGSRAYTRWIAHGTTGEFRHVWKIPGVFGDSLVSILKIMLIEVLRDEIIKGRSWAYKIDTDFIAFGEFYKFYIDIDGLRLNALNQLGLVIENCIASLQAREELFERCKNCVIAAIKIREEKSDDVRDEALDELVLLGRIISRSELIGNFERMTMDDIRKVLKWLEPDKMWTLIKRPK